MTRLSDYCDVSLNQIDLGRGPYTEITIKAGRPKRKRVVPPAGEKYAFEYDAWPHQITVSVSPTGKSIHIWKDETKLT